MEYGTKAWMGAFIDHHPDEAVVVIKVPTNHPSSRYGVEVYDGAGDPISHNELNELAKSDELEALMWELDLLREEIDLEFDRDWETFVSGIYHGDLAKAVEVCRKNRSPVGIWGNIRVYVMKQAEGYRIKNGIKA